MAAKVIVSTENMEYADWLAYRRQGIGGSDASIVCGLSRYRSPVELWMDKTGQMISEEAGEPAYWGTQLEGIVRTEFSKRTGVDVRMVKQLLQNEDYPFMQANLDGVCEHPDYETCIFEAKTASAYKADEWEDSIPDEYQLQIQHYMAVTGYKGAYIAVLIGGNTFKWKFVERDEEIIAMIIELETKFWEHVQDGTPPVIDGSDATAKYLSEKFKNGIADSEIVLPESAGLILQEYEDACTKLEDIKEQKQKAENMLKEMMGDNEIGKVGGRIITWKSISQERLDSKTFKVEHPKLFQKYATKSSYRRFMVKAAV